MRIDAPTLPVTTRKDRLAIKGVAASEAIKPLAINAYEVHDVVLHRDHQPPDNENPQPSEQRAEGEDRRKICRRVRQQAVLIEFRSAINRRRQNLRGTDAREHIDEEA